MLVLVSGYIRRICLLLGLYLTVCAACALALTSDKDNSDLPDPANPVHNFTVPEPLWSYPVLSAQYSERGQDAVLPKFYPLLEEKLPGLEFEQAQSIIIPGGILDTLKGVIYLENGDNSIVALDLDTGKTIKQINHICSPIAVVGSSLIALAKTSRQAKASYDLLMLGNKKVLGYKARWTHILLPDWLDLPADGERQKFVFNVHCYNSILSVTWQASEKMMFPNALSWIAPYISPPALEGRFSCDLKSRIIISQSMEESNNDFSGYLTADENTIPAQVILNADTIAIKKYDPYLFALIRAYPPEQNISKSGIVGNRELQVRDLSSGKILWTHTLPAAFIPLSF